MHEGDRLFFHIKEFDYTKPLPMGKKQNELKSLTIFKVTVDGPREPRSKGQLM